jgi:hypothetical protein
VPRRHQCFGQDERRSHYDAGLLPNLCKHFLPVVDPKAFAVAKHAYIRTSNEDLLAQVVLQSVHHADDHDEGAYANEHAADRNDADQRQQLRSAAAPQISPRDL